jgi:hypothetical protein
MKVNLIYGRGDVLHTHLNINPFAEDVVEGKIVRADVKNLDKLVDTAEVDQLVALDVIDYLPITDIEKTLANWVSKLAHEGKIIIGGVDLYEVAKAMGQYKMDVSQANLLLHGEQTKPYLIKRISFTAIGLSDFLSGVFELKILKKRISQFNFIVEAQRT